METLIVERDDRGVVTVTMNRPEVKNAMNRAMFDELGAVFQEVAASTTDRVLVLTGSPGAFCAGGDLSPGGANDEPSHPLYAMRNLGTAAVALNELPKPTIAKVNGVAVGAGCNIAIGCDLVIAAESARFSEIFVRRGLSIDFGGSYLLPRLIGLHKAKELALLGDIISAAEAERIGIVNRVVADDDLDGAVDELAARLAAGPPLAISLTKKLLNQSFDVSMAQAVEAESQAQISNTASEDGKEAIAAFREKRDPVFKGR